jgi:hypothetical protein
MKKHVAALSASAPSYAWVKTDAGRSESQRPRQKNDCTVRALASARGLTYDEAYDELKQAGRKCGRGFAIQVWLNAQPWALKLPFPAVKGERRMNPVTFVAQFPLGNFICRSSKHVFAVIDGKVLDEVKIRGDRCIYTAWRV